MKCPGCPIPIKPGDETIAMNDTIRFHKHCYKVFLNRLRLIHRNKKRAYHQKSTR